MSRWTDFLDPNEPDGAYLAWKKVEPRVGISRTTAWRLQRSGDFPKPYVVSPGRVAYRESEVEAWKASRGHRSAVASRPAPTPDARRAETVLDLPMSAEPPSWSPPPPAQISEDLAPRSNQPGGEQPPGGSRRGPRARRHSSNSDQMKFEF